MTTFTDFIQKIPTQYIPRIEQAISDACRVLGDPNATSKDYDTVSHKLTDLQQRIGHDSLSALKKEIEARLKQRGVGYVAPRVNDLLSRTENVRKMTNPGYWEPLKHTAISKLMLFGGFLASVFVISGSLHQGNQVLSEIDRQIRSAELPAAIANVTLPTAEFSAFHRRIRAAIDVVSSSPQASLPSNASTADDMPVRVTVTRSTGDVDSYVLPFRPVYNASPPEVQEQMRSPLGSLAPASSASPPRRCPMARSTVTVKSEFAQGVISCQ